MLRSFVSLARSLNMSRTVDELGFSRQTVRRHINELQSIRGVQLFDFQDRKYSLTKDGRQALYEAEVLLQRADNWLQNNANLVDGLPSVNLNLDDNLPFHAQRHPLHTVWTAGPPLLRAGLQSWMNSGFRIEDDEMAKIRKYLIIYRKNRDDWICTEVGDKSSYVSWLGWSWAKSAVGSSFESDPIGNAADAFVLDAYETVSRTGGAWYDHISTKLLRSDNPTPTPVNYQRLVFSMLFPNGEPAIASLVARTNNVQIYGFELGDGDRMPDSELMEFDM